MRKPKINQDDVVWFQEYGLNISQRVLFLGSESYDDGGASGTDGNMAQRFIKNMLILSSISNDPIKIIMNNPGGDEYDGYAIYDTICTSKSVVTIVVAGQACSMGSIILQAAANRVMMPRAVQMIHYGNRAMDDHAKSQLRYAREGLRNDNWMEDMYLERIREKHPGFKRSKLISMLNFDTFLTAQQSVDLGLADSVLGIEYDEE